MAGVLMPPGTLAERPRALLNGILSTLPGVNAAAFGVRADNPDNYDAIMRAVVYANNLAGGVAGNGGAVVHFPGGRFKYSRTIDLSSYPYVLIAGETLLTTELRYTGSGTAYQFLPTTFGGATGLRDIRIVADNTTATTTVGIDYGNTYGFELTNVVVSKFYSNVILDNTLFWTEGSKWSGVQIFNRSGGRGVSFRRTGGTDSFAYTRFENVNLFMAGGSGEIGVWIGDDVTAGLGINVYNSILNIETHMKSGSTAYRFGENARIVASNGLIAGESSVGFGLCTPVTYDNPANCGFFDFNGTFKTSTTLENVESLLACNRIMSFRRSSNDTSSAGKWIKCAVLTAGRHEFFGRVYSQVDSGLNASRTAIIDFSFGWKTREAGYVPLVVYHGNTSGLTGASLPTFRVYSDASGNKIVYFQQTKFSRYANFEWAFDPSDLLNFTTPWQVVSDPSGDATLTLVFDSSTAKPSDLQPIYMGTGKLAARLAGSKTYGSAVSVTAGAAVTTTVTVTGAALGDAASASHSVFFAGLIISAVVSAADTVTVTLYNPTGSAIALSTGTLRAWATPP